MSNLTEPFLLIVNIFTLILFYIAITSMDDFYIKIYGPRQDYWYPMKYEWTNEMMLKDTVGKDHFTFRPDYSHEYI